jgi:hypothetical protein
VRKKLAVGTGITLGAALGMSAAAQAADFTVTNLSDGPGAGPAGSLRNAAALAENGTGPDRILFQSGLTGTITLTNGELFIDEPLEILGAGANVTVSGNNTSRIFLIVTATGDDVKISDLTLTAANPGSAVEGGAIKLDHADLTVVNSTISNSSAKDGGAILATSHSDETTTIRNSTISGNHALAGFGGGIGSYYAPVTIEKTTMSGNTATGRGEAIYSGGFPLTVRNSTISGNTAAVLDDALGMFEGSITLENSTVAGNTGDGISGSYGTAITLTNSVVADNTHADVNESSYHLASASFSLVENPGTTTITDSVPGSNVMGQDPQLAALGSNGGPTQTQKPAPTSPVVDRGKIPGGATTDQRGLPRPFDVPSIANVSASDGTDMGAVELQATDFPTAAAPAPPSTPATPKKKCKKHKKRAASAKKCKKKKQRPSSA